MSRRKVLSTLGKNQCTVLRDSGGHTVYVCPCGKHRAPVPRHSTITAGVVGSIERQMACLDEGWLQP